MWRSQIPKILPCLNVCNQVSQRRVVHPAPTRILVLKGNSMQPKARHVTATALDLSHVKKNGFLFQICEQDTAVGGHGDNRVLHFLPATHLSLSILRASPAIFSATACLRSLPTEMGALVKHGFCKAFLEKVFFFTESISFLATVKFVICKLYQTRNIKYILL